MINVRRWYVYIACTILLNSLAWATIALLRNLSIRGLNASKTDLALQIAFIIVSLPLFLVHWLWAQRLSTRDEEERSSFPRRLYLYGMLAAFQGPCVANLFIFTRSFLHWVTDTMLDLSYPYRDLSQGEFVFYNLIAVLVLAVLWAYGWWLKRGDDDIRPEGEASLVLHQVYGYVFSLAGLVMTTISGVSLLHWLFETISRQGDKIGMGKSFLITQIALLLVGLPLWLVIWRMMQRRFQEDTGGERASVVRKIYLYLIAFAAILMVVTTAALVLADILSSLMGVPPSGEGIQLPLAIVLGVGVVWAYHAYVLREDAALGEISQQALVRRIYLYLMAGVGLGALLIGLGGDLSVLIRAVSGRGFIQDLREQLANFTAALLAGLPVWFVHWRSAQAGAAQQDMAQTSEAEEKHIFERQTGERSSFVRSLYLYIFIFLATMTVLGSAIYLVSQLVELALGARRASGLLVDIGQAIAYTIIAVGVWLYHGAILRQDRQMIKQEAKAQRKLVRVLLLDGGDLALGQALGQALKKVPDAEVIFMDLTGTAGGTDDDGEQEPQAAEDGKPDGALSPAEALKAADVIIGPWTLLTGGPVPAVDGPAPAQAGLEPAAIAASPARKIMLPTALAGWDWVGVERWQPDFVAKQAAEAVEQISAGEAVQPKRALGAVAIAGIALAVIIGLCMLIQVVSLIFEML
ncbi:DUF5671 domain-containing protein [Chloroflexota bacterium]